MKPGALSTDLNIGNAAFMVDGEATLSCNLHRIDDYVRPYIGKLLIKSLTIHRLEPFYDQLRNTPAIPMAGHKETGTIAPSLIEKIHLILRSALNQTIRWDYLR